MPGQYGHAAGRQRDIDAAPGTGSPVKVATVLTDKDTIHRSTYTAGNGENSRRKVQNVVTDGTADGQLIGMNQMSSVPAYFGELLQ